VNGTSDTSSEDDLTSGRETRVRHIGADEVWGSLGVGGAVDALDAAIGATGFPPVPQRLHLHEDGQQLLLMPAFADGYAGVKLITIDPDNPARGLSFVNGIYTLFAPPGLEPVATIDGRALTDVRTAAVSGLATRYLARAAATRLVVLGAGAQARSHVRAMAAVRPLEDIAIVARRPEAAEALVAAVAEHLDVPARVGTHDDLRDADIVCTCTSSASPIVGPDVLPDGVHVNAIGAYLPTMAELAPEVVAASRVVVETRDAALAEKGDLLRAEETGAWHRDDIAADLTEVVRDGRTVRRSDTDRTLFASVGVAYEDLVVARAVATAVLGDLEDGT
jgi:ornithine cyclodeaminase/alanine dehydrogenase-like protein (mu-crystallin family)